MRINVIIPKEKNDCFDLFSTSSVNLSYEETYGDKCGEFVCGYWDLEVDVGLTIIRKSKLLRRRKKETLGPTWDFFLEDIPSIIGVV